MTSLPVPESIAKRIWANIVESEIVYLLNGGTKLYALAFEVDEDDFDIHLVSISDREHWGSLAHSYIDTVTENGATRLPNVARMVKIGLGEFAYESIRNVYAHDESGADVLDLNVVIEAIENEAFKITEHGSGAEIKIGNVELDLGPVPESESAPVPEPTPKTVDRAASMILEFDHGLDDETLVLINLNKVVFKPNSFSPESYNKKICDWITEFVPGSMFDPMFDRAANLNDHMIRIANKVRAIGTQRFDYLLHPMIRQHYEFLDDIEMVFEISVLNYGHEVGFQSIHRFMFDFHEYQK